MRAAGVELLQVGPPREEMCQVGVPETGSAQVGGATIGLLGQSGLLGQRLLGQQVGQT